MQDLPAEPELPVSAAALLQVVGVELVVHAGDFFVASTVVLDRSSAATAPNSLFLWNYTRPSGVINWTVESVTR
jgi:hypothetical protein